MAKLTHEQMSKIGKSNVAKSKSHERRVANLLAEWAGVQFRRRRVEGRDSTVIERESTADVIPVSGDIWFSIEAKSGRNFSIDGLLANTTGSVFTGWWFQCCYDASLLIKTFGKPYYPLLFFKPHANFDWVAISQVPFSSQILRAKDGSVNTAPWFPHLRYDTYNTCGPITDDISHSKKHPVMHTMELSPLYFCRWKDFANYVDPVSFFRNIPEIICDK